MKLTTAQQQVIDCVTAEAIPYVMDGMSHGDAIEAAFRSMMNKQREFAQEDTERAMIFRNVVGITVFHDARKVADLQRAVVGVEQDRRGEFYMKMKHGLDAKYAR